MPDLIPNTNPGFPIQLPIAPPGTSTPGLPSPLPPPPLTDSFIPLESNSSPANNLTARRNPINLMRDRLGLTRVIATPENLSDGQTPPSTIIHPDDIELFYTRPNGNRFFILPDGQRLLQITPEGRHTILSVHAVTGDLIESRPRLGDKNIILEDSI